MSATQTQHHTSAAEPAAAVTVYSRAGCVQCQATHLALDRAGIAHRTVDLDTGQDAAERLRRAGHQTLPVVEADNKVWAGYRPDKIRSLRG